MKIFPDSNVWVSAFTTRGLCDELIRLLLRRHGLGNIEVLLGKPVRDETIRVLVEKFHATEGDVAPVRTAMDLAHNIPASSVDPPAIIADPDDIPVIACAIAAGTNILVTGDKALLELGKIGNMVILSPRQLFEWLIANG